MSKHRSNVHVSVLASSPFGLAFGVVTAAVVAACSAASDGDEPNADTTVLSSSCTAPAIDPMASLVVTDKAILSKSAFSLSNVLKTIATTGLSTQTPAALSSMLADDFASRAFTPGTGPRCDDHKDASGNDTINGFPIDCPRGEYDLLAAGAAPVALINRFDLAPTSGANCGQYRISFAPPAGDVSDHFWIFEGVLPNPDPSAGLAACAPVAQFWAGLGSKTEAQRAAALQTFYFTGLPGFEPVVKASHYGIGGGTNTGQIRTNTLKGATAPPPAPNSPWQLREFRIARTCASTTSCSIIIEPSPVSNNPYLGLFSEVGAMGTLTPFQQLFVTDMGPLVRSDNVTSIALPLMPKYDAGQSNSQSNTNDYGRVAISPAFRSAITTRLAAFKRTDLTVQNVLDRATTQSCGGCHEVSNNKALGGTAAAWPSSNGFTQIDESGNLSPALKNVFLPYRARVLENFLVSQCLTDGGTASPAAAAAANSSDEGTTIGGSQVGAVN